MHYKVFTKTNRGRTFLYFKTLSDALGGERQLGPCGRHTNIVFFMRYQVWKNKVGALETRMIHLMRGPETCLYIGFSN